MPPGAPHTHFSKNIDKSNIPISIKIFCTPNNKEYVISGTKENDSVYIPQLVRALGNTRLVRAPASPSIRIC